MQAKISILFYTKRAKTNTQGLVPIYQRITIDGKRIETSTKIFVEQSKWSVEKSKLKGNSEEAKRINTHLELLKNQIYDLQKQIVLNGDQVCFDTLKNKLTGKAEKARMLIPIFEDHNKKMETLIGDEFALGTLERYKTSLKHTIDFLQWKFGVKDIDIKKINHSFITDYEFYLRTVRKCNNNSAVKYVKNFGKIIRLCISNGWLGKNPFVNYKAKVKEVVRVFLTKDELEIIMNKNFNNERISQVRDIFIFSCYTGLAYIDAANLTPNNIVIGIDGEKWIYTFRQKTDSQSNIPLLQPANNIIEKYKEHPICKIKNKLLPILSNQKMNAYLKEIAAICNINKELTFHIARHTFATTVTLSNGVPIESVSKMLGHSSIKQTQHYAKVLDKKVSDDMKMLRDKFNNDNTQINELVKVGGYR
jgi:site-specific recombinase XerD